MLSVIACLNEERHRPTLLAHIVADSAIDRLVVADGGSTDASREIVTHYAQSDPRVSLLDNPRRLQSAGVNRAVVIHGADAHWLLRIDAYCGYPDRYASMLLGAVASTQASSIVVPMITRAQGGVFQLAVAPAQNSVLGRAAQHTGTWGKAHSWTTAITR